MAIAGAAFGASRALEEIVAERMKRQMLEEEIAARQQRAELDARRLAEVEQQNAWERGRAEKLDTERAEERRLKADADATAQRGRSNMAGVAAMGLDPATAKREIAFSSLQSGANVPSGVMEAMTPPKPVQYTHTDPKSGNKSLRFANPDQIPPEGLDLGNEPQKPQQGPRTPLWVRMPDGSVKDINNVAPPGSGPIDVVAERQRADKNAGNERAVAAMKAYGDDMLSVIDSLIDADGNLKPDVAGVIGGFQGARPEWAYLGEDSQGALANIDRLQSMLNIDTLRDMKSQSRTGATGFGALSERELNVVESSASKLRRRRQGDPEYAAELKRIRDAIMTGRGAIPSNAPPGGSANLSGVSLRFNPATGKLEPVRQ